MANCSSSKDCLYLPHKILIFRSLQELQGVDPHLVDEDSLSGGEEDVEDDWGSIWEEVAEEDGELLRDAAAERFNTSTEALAAGEEILQERGHENVESVEEPAVRPSRPDKSGRAPISGHFGKIARITPGFL